MKRHQVRNPLEYHATVRPGKIEVVPTKPCKEQQDLTFAYSPGVAEAAMTPGVAQKRIDIELYRDNIKTLLAESYKRMGAFLASYGW